MKRRAFLLLGGAAAAWPRSVRSANVKRVIGFLVPGTKAAYDQYIAAFVQRLRELSWTEGENVAIVYRWTEGLKDRLAEIAAEFARLKVDVIVTSASEGVIVAKQATSAIPIVFAATSDPVAAGLVESLAHPGVNVTGLSAQSTETAGKSVELLRELVPGLQRLAILSDPAGPGNMAETASVQAAARTAGLEPLVLAVRNADEIASAFDGLKSRADALYCVPVRSLAPIACASLHWRSPRGCRRFTAAGTMWMPEATYPTGRTSAICSAASLRRQAGRYSRRTADQILFIRQSDNGESARFDDTAVDLAARRRSD
jgi:ABC-type uncharacterized transport system substrate-binding protein